MLSAYSEGVVIQVGVAILLGLGYWIAVNTGRFSFGHAGFMAIGAYGSSILTVKMNWPLELAMVVGGIAAAVAGALIGWTALRLSLLYLAIITLVFAELVKILLSNWSYVGGASGLPGPSGTSLSLVATTVVLVVAYLWLVSRSRVGLAYAALREDEDAAEALGLNTTRIEVAAFTQSAFVTGLAGALSAHFFLFISPDDFGAEQSLVIILYAVFGGIQTFLGPIAGAVALELYVVVFDFLTEWFLFVYGGLFVVLMIVRPQGIIGRRTHSARSRRRAPLSRVNPSAPP